MKRAAVKAHGSSELHKKAEMQLQPSWQIRSKVEIFLKIMFLGLFANRGGIDHLIGFGAPNSEVLEEYPPLGVYITRPNKLTAYSTRKQKQTPNNFIFHCRLHFGKSKR